MNYYTRWIFKMCPALGWVLEIEDEETTDCVLKTPSGEGATNKGRGYLTQGENARAADALGAQGRCT